MKIRRVFVGTMYAGEGDLDRCVDAIASQTGDVYVSHAVISNLPEIEAHNKLWSLWLAARNDFDAFLKVDADTVLSHANVISGLCGLMTDDPTVTGIQAPLHDFFTDQLILGLNFFSKSVKFDQSKDPLYCDRNVDSGHVKVIREYDILKTKNLVPAGLHCHSASLEQAFRYGLHRSLKNRSAEHVLLANANNPHPLRDMALKGFAAGRTWTHGKVGHCYTDVEFKSAFKSALKSD